MANPTNLTALPAKQTADNGGEFAALLQPKHRVAFQAIGAAYAQAEVTALRDALVTVGIMKAS
jgi:stage V sporulation protein SpoVS